MLEIYRRVSRHLSRLLMGLLQRQNVYKIQPERELEILLHP